jgi:hypothetical protein
MLNVYEINLLQTLAFMFKHQHDLLPSFHESSLQRVNHSYNTRLSRYGYKENSPLSIKKFNIMTRGPYIWNHFTCKKAKETQTIAAFKNETKKFLLKT